MPGIGMMDSAFFVSRSELMNWLNGYFKLNVTKVEQCANGAAYCLIVESCYPGKVAMKRVNWNSRQEHESIPNYKILQAAFQKLDIDKHIDVDKLTRGKPQDNLEMLQFMKYWWDSVGPAPDFDPQECRRGMPRLPEWAQVNSILGEKNRSTRMTAPRPRRAAQHDRIVKAARSPEAVPSTVSSSTTELAKLKTYYATEVSAVRKTLDGLEAERDYYFRKLREVEVLCQLWEEERPEKTAEDIKLDIQKILYAKDDENREGLTPLRPERSKGENVRDQ
jgi:RP/EB family microtubule-associated protein